MKPVGMLMIPNIPDHRIVGENIWQAIRDDIERLDLEVVNGRLNKAILEIPPQSHWANYSGQAHFYCQPGKEEVMAKVVDIQDALFRESEHPDISRLGEYLGYSKADIQMFNRGGYTSRPLTGWLLRATHDLRKDRRLAQEKVATPYDCDLY